MPTPAPLPLRFERDGAALLCTIESASILGEDGTKIGDAIVDRVRTDSEGLRLVAIDMGRVNSLNSVALGMLVTVQSEMLRYRIEFALVALSPAIRDLLKTMRMTGVFRIVDSRAQLRAAPAT